MVEPTCDLSIVVSTFNRAADVRRFFDALAGIEVRPGRTWELVLVDNNSTDDTAKVVNEQGRCRKFALQYLFEARQGKSFGLNTGLAAAKGRVIALTDDDVVVPPDWVDNVLDYFDANPDASCVGGMVTLHDPADYPMTIRLATAPETVDLHNFSPVAVPVAGCNMSFRASVLADVGPFDVDLGPGRPLKSAEDLDVLYRLVRRGARLEYHPPIRVEHNHGRRTAQELDALQSSYLLGRGGFYAKHTFAGDRVALRLAYWEFRGLVRRGEWRALRTMMRGAALYLFRARTAETANRVR